MKIKMTEEQSVKLGKYLQENGMVLVGKDTDPNTIKKYTDKDIKVGVVDTKLDDKSTL